MGQFDSERWYIVVLGNKYTCKYHGCRYLLATSAEDAKERAKTDTLGNPCPYDALQVIFLSTTQPETVYQFK